MHLLRPLVLALVAVMMTFVAALWVSHARSSLIDPHAHAIAASSNSADSVHSAHEITRLRGESRDLAFALGALGVIAALVAGLIAFRVMRKQARLVAAHGELLDRRAKELEAFAGRVAHDLRNPLSALAMRVEGHRLDGFADGAAIEKLASITARMDRMIEGLLQFSTSAAAPAPGARANLRTAVDGAVADARIQAERVAANVIVEEVPAIDVACAPGTLASVLTNLLGNAAKYIVDGSGARTISVRAQAHEGNVRVEVADTGPGLPPGTEQQVFEPFYRVGVSKQPGLGIGLATVKRITEAYGGRVGVASMPGRGCTFWFELPKAN